MLIGKQTGHSIHVRTSFFDAYSDRHVLGLQLCAGVIALCCDVLCCARGSDNILVHHCCTRYCCCCIPVQHKQKPLKKENEGSMLLYKMLEDMCHAGSRQLCMLASVVWYVRKRKHSKARHRTAGHDTTAPHGAVPRR